MTATQQQAAGTNEAMKSFTLICDPNCSMGGTAEFRLHATGCQDIARHMKKPGFKAAGGKSTINAESAESAIASELASLSECFGEGTYDRDSFHVCNCCK